MCSDPQLCCQASSEQTEPLNSGTHHPVQVPFEGKLKSHPPSRLFIIQTRWNKVKNRSKKLLSRGCERQLVPDSACMRAAFALASSKAVIQRCRSTSQLAFRWYVCAPPFEMTKLQASSTVMVAVARFIVPRHVWPISAWVLINKNLTEKTCHKSKRAATADHTADFPSSLIKMCP